MSALILSKRTEVWQSQLVGTTSDHRYNSVETGQRHHHVSNQNRDFQMLPKDNICLCDTKEQGSPNTPTSVRALVRKLMKRLRYTTEDTINNPASVAI